MTENVHALRCTQQVTGAARALLPRGRMLGYKPRDEFENDALARGRGRSNRGFVDRAALYDDLFGRELGSVFEREPAEPFHQRGRMLARVLRVIAVQEVAAARVLDDVRLNTCREAGRAPVGW